MKSTLLSLLALGTAVSAYPSTMHHAHLHSHKRQDASAQPWTNYGSGGFGLAYDLMADNGGCRTADQIASEIGQFAAEGYSLIRTYDIGCDVGALAAAISSHPGMKLFAGINGISNVQGDLSKLIGMLSPYWSVVDTINIGNEVVNSGAASAGAVAAAVSQGRGMLSGAGYNGQVVTVDTFVAHLNNPSLASTSDYVCANTYAFFDGGVTAEGAGNFVKTMQGQVANIAGGKRVVVTESGWPKCGNSIGQAVAGVSQQAAAIGSLKAAFASSPSELVLFQSFDAKYKQPGAGGVEQCWGIH